MVKCSFCGREERSFIGIHLIKNTGTIAYFCSSKCRKNALLLKRDKRRVRWTEAFRIGKAGEAEKIEKATAENA